MAEAFNWEKFDIDEPANALARAQVESFMYDLSVAEREGSASMPLDDVLTFMSALGVQIGAPTLASPQDIVELVPDIQQELALAQAYDRLVQEIEAATISSVAINPAFRDDIVLAMRNAIESLQAATGGDNQTRDARRIALERLLAGTDLLDSVDETRIVRKNALSDFKEQELGLFLQTSFKSVRRSGN